MRDGLGTLVCEDGSRYIGPWKADQQHGLGITVSNEGLKKLGEWQNGQFVRWVIEQPPIEE